MHTAGSAELILTQNIRTCTARVEGYLWDGYGVLTQTKFGNYTLSKLGMFVNYIEDDILQHCL